MEEGGAQGELHLNAANVKKIIMKMAPSLGFPLGIPITLMTMRYLRYHQSRELRMCGQLLKM